MVSDGNDGRYIMTRLFRKSISILIGFCFVLYPQGVYALPQGYNVVGGTASNFDYSTADELTVTQTSNRLATEWQSFSIGSPEKVEFIQPGISSIALNKVVTGNPSQILGTLKANGRVFLINPNGIVFGIGSSVDTAGLIASTLDLDQISCQVKLEWLRNLPAQPHSDFHSAEKWKKYQHLL